MNQTFRENENTRELGTFMKLLARTRERGISRYSASDQLGIVTRILTSHKITMFVPVDNRGAIDKKHDCL